MKQPTERTDAYRRIVWSGYEGWFDERSAAGALLASAPDAHDLVGRDPSGTQGRKRNRVARVEFGDEVLWVKWFLPRGPLSWLRYAGRPTKGEKAWALAFALRDAGIDTPRPLAGLARRGALGRLDALVIFEDFANARNFTVELEAAGGSRGELLAAAAQFLSRFHDAGFRHRDLQGANLLVARDGRSYRFSLVDVNRARAYSRLSFAQRLRDLERLPLAEGDLDPFFDAYAGAAGQRAAAAFRRRVKQRERLGQLPRPLDRVARRLWYYWREIANFTPGRRR